MPSCEDHALPLQSERGAAELLVQTYAVLIALAGKVGVDANPADGSSFSKEVDGQAANLASLRTSGSADAWGEWDKLAELIYTFDAHIQDRLAGKSLKELAGYQLGRGLAECYWALDPALSDPVNPTAWGFLLGPKRVSDLSRLLGSLSAYFPTYNAAAIQGTLQVWRCVAADENWRNDAYGCLYKQVHRWYELTVLQRDPSGLLPPSRWLFNPGVALRVLRHYYDRIAMVCFAGLVAAAALIRSTHSEAAIKWVGSEIPKLWGPFVTLIVATGLAKALFSTPQIVRRYSNDWNTTRIAIYISTVPAKGQARRAIKGRPL
jgi:hypothetical protein